MKNKRFMGALGLMMVALALLACEASNVVALVVKPTATPTRTLRPTFTPRPSATSTPEDTPTPEPTDTPAASPTPTRRAVVATPRPAATKPPTAPPAPQFAWRVLANDSTHGKCSTGAPVFEVKGRINKSGVGYIAGVHVVLLDKSGHIVAQRDSWGPDQMNPEWGVSCFESKNLFNYQLDATAGWYNGPLVLHLTKSATDLTPISPDAILTFDSSGGRYYIDFIQ